MNWKTEAVYELKSYATRKSACENIREKIKILEAQAIALNRISSDEPVMGGSSKAEDKLINNIVERELLKENLTILERALILTERGLASLNDREREVLNGFYINRTSTYIDELCYRFNIEQAQVYRIKNEALRRFTLAMYGVIET